MLAHAEKGVKNVISCYIFLVIYGVHVERLNSLVPLSAAAATVITKLSNIRKLWQPNSQVLTNHACYASWFSLCGPVSEALWEGLIWFAFLFLEPRSLCTVVTEQCHPICSGQTVLMCYVIGTYCTVT